MAGSNSRNLNCNSGNTNKNSNNRANGFSVRCLKDYWKPSRLNCREGFRIFLLLFMACILSGCAANSAQIDIHSEASLTIELKGFDGLREQTLFSGSLSSHGNRIDIPYNGLALLVFAQGQTYPVIVGDTPFTLSITTPSRPPAFSTSEANSCLYDVLTGAAPDTCSPPDAFISLMFEAGQLLESTRSIRNLDQLRAGKNEFHRFVRDNYAKLKHSDMVRRLISQYFMMHEYVDYHVAGAPAQDIKVKYQREVLNGVGGWLEALRPHIPEHEILNYIVSLYYQRSMVTLAGLIVDQYRDIAYCPGGEKKTWIFPPDLLVAGANGSGERELGTIRGEKIFAFVSDACPVSMVETVVTARRLADRKEDARLVVIPLEQLSETHLAMSRMVAGNENMLFLDDEQWRKEHLAEKITLPFFVERSCTGRLPIPL